jgi:spore germination cell wall hydrolase CwlJ-like protein
MTPQTDTDWLALLIWDEARGEPRDGQAAVGRVVLNRARLHYQSDGSIVGTILKPMQFSGFWCDMVAGRYRRVALTTAQAMQRAADKFARATAQTQSWAMLQGIASQLLDGSFEGDHDYHRLTDQAVLYVNLEIARPVWATPENLICKIGAHSFFTDPGLRPTVIAVDFGAAATKAALG